MRVVVTDGEQRAALAVIRSLGRAGHRVLLTHASPRAIGAVSRYATERRQVPDALAAPREFTTSIETIAREWRADLVLPVTDASCLALLTHGSDELRAILPLPSLAAFRRAADKNEAANEAQKLGLAIPEQLFCAEPGVAVSKALEFPPPYVIKPIRSVTGSNGEAMKWVVRHAATAEDLQQTLNRLPRAAFPVLIQRRIVGPGMGLFLMVWNGELIATFAHRRIRERPPSGGVSVYCESVPVREDLLASARKLLDCFEWRGVAMVELKEESATGRCYLMELNGRFWGSLQLAVNAGVDFPAVLVQAAMGATIKPSSSFRVGVKNRWWWGDVDHLLARLRKSPEQLALPPGAASRTATIASFLSATFRATPDQVWSWSDPRPFLRETMNWIRRR